MPTKQTRESIEADLNASEEDHAVRKLRNMIDETYELDRYLQKMEGRLGLPAFYRSKPVVERMAAVGFSQTAIDHVQTMFDAIPKILSSRGNELPEDVKRELAADAHGELVGAELLAGIVESHRRG
jgi:hypothetical protein